MTSSDSELIHALESTAKNLLWVSESEAPFDVVTWDDCTIDQLDDATLLKLTHHSEDAPVECVEFDQFFAYPTQIQDWQNEDETSIVHQYQQLVDTLKRHLHDLKVYRVGEVELDIYIIGATESGYLAGLTTKAVET